MSAISIRLPDSLHKKVRELAKRDNVSINQMITIAVAEKLSAIETEDYLDKRAKKGSKEKFLKVLKRIPNNEPEIMDRI
jgi:predicted transcriptional regulator